MTSTRDTPTPAIYIIQTNSYPPQPTKARKTLQIKYVELRIWILCSYKICSSL